MSQVDAKQRETSSAQWSGTERFIWEHVTWEGTGKTGGWSVTRCLLSKNRLRMADSWHRPDVDQMLTFLSTLLLSSLAIPLDSLSLSLSLFITPGDNTSSLRWLLRLCNTWGGYHMKLQVREVEVSTSAGYLCATPFNPSIVLLIQRWILPLSLSLSTSLSISFSLNNLNLSYL